MKDFSHLVALLLRLCVQPIALDDSVHPSVMIHVINNQIWCSYRKIDAGVMNKIMMTL